MVIGLLFSANISTSSRERKINGAGINGEGMKTFPQPQYLFHQMIPYFLNFSYRVVRLISSILAALARLFPFCSSVWISSCLSFSSSVRQGTSACFNVRSRFRSVAVIRSPSASSRALRRVFLSSRMLPGQGYRLRAASASRSNPCTRLWCSSERCPSRKRASGRMSSGHSERRGTRMVNSFSRWNRSSRKRPPAMASSRFSLVAAIRRMSKLRSRVEPTGL